MIVGASFPMFYELDGTALNSGYIYFGVVNQNPETSPISVFYDEAMTIPAAQPLRTLNGVIVNNGNVTNVYVASQYSITVKNKNGILCYSLPDSGAFDSGSFLESVLASSAGSNSVGFIQAGLGTVVRTVQDELRDRVSLKQFAGVVGDGVNDDTAGIQAALAACNISKKTIWVPNGDYIWNGPDITEDYVCMEGEAMPVPNAGETALVGGARFIGTMTFRGDRVSLRNIGVDHGSAAFPATNGDALFLGHSTAAGEYARIENCIGLCRNWSSGDAGFGHGVGVEGYLDSDVINVTGIKGYHSVAMKLIRGTAHNIRGYRGANTCVVIRSNDPAGRTRDLNVTNLTAIAKGVSGSGATGSDYGVYIVIDNDAARINLTNVSAQNADIPLSIRCNAGAGVSEINMVNVVTDVSGTAGIDIQAGAGSIFDVTMANIQTVHCAAFGMRVQSGRVITLANYFASSNSGSAYTPELLRVEAAVERTMFSNITLVENYDNAKPGGLKYLNSANNNSLGQHNCFLTDVNLGIGSTSIPGTGYSTQTVSGATVTLNAPVYSGFMNSFIAVDHGGVAATVVDFVRTVGTSGVRFPKGYKVTILNNDATNLTITNAGNVLTKSGGNLVVAGSRGASFVFTGAFWLEA